MTKKKGAVRCPLCKDGPFTNCDCFKRHGPVEARLFECNKCHGLVKWNRDNWGRSDRPPYKHANGECPDSKLGYVEVITAPDFLTTSLILLVSLFHEVALTSPPPSEQEEMAPLTCEPCPAVEVVIIMTTTSNIYNIRLFSPYCYTGSVRWNTEGPSWRGISFSCIVYAF